tara:strand:+ start:1731 stop:2579 length:849 start_codon:yes stop_codon:yes gene_type:complete
MSKTENTDNAKSQVEEVNPEVVEDGEADSSFYYFYSQGCGWCKKTEPIVDELNSEGKFDEILKLDMADPDNQSLANELKQEYNVQCGTPWFINEATGKGICGFREKDVIEKWLNGEDIPEPPRPKGPIPKPPFHGAPEKEIKAWKKEYAKWLKDNEHLPDNQKRTAKQILEMPRPKSDPPKPPTPNMSQEEKDKWIKEYDDWGKENDHLPNLQPAAAILQRMEAMQARQNGGAQAPPTQVNGAAVPGNPGDVTGNVRLNSIEAKVQALEVKVDKIIAHFGIK